MNVIIEHKISEIEMKLYEFDIYNFDNKLTATYSRFWHSRRNDENDIWGHLRSTHFHNLKLKEQRTFEDLHDYYPDSWGL